MTRERWKTIPGFKNYIVSNLGRVRSKARVVLCSNGHRRRVGGKKIGAARGGDGYVVVALYNEEKKVKKSVYLHRLVMEVFEGPCPPGKEVRHRNSVPMDCRLDNLRYATRARNLKDRQGQGTSPLGSANPFAKLNVVTVTLLRIGGAKIGKLLSIGTTQIYRLLRYETWNAINWIRDIENMRKAGCTSRIFYKLKLEAIILLADTRHPKRSDLMLRLNSI